LSEWTGSTEVH